LSPFSIRKSATIAGCAGRKSSLVVDRGAFSEPAEGPSSGTNMVEIERWTEPVPPVRAFEPPDVAAMS
jgi:hypothetical protein